MDTDKTKKPDNIRSLKVAETHGITGATTRQEARRNAHLLASQCQTFWDIALYIPSIYVREMLPGDVSSVHTLIDESKAADEIRWRIAEKLLAKWEKAQAERAFNEAEDAAVDCYLARMRAAGFKIDEKTGRDHVIAGMSRRWHIAGMRGSL